MYKLCDLSGKVICNICSDASSRDITLTDIVGRKIGYGKVEYRAALVNRVHLYLNSGVKIATLDREMGLESSGTVDSVKISGSEIGTERVPIRKFDNDYIVEQLFGYEYLRNRGVYPRETRDTNEGYISGGYSSGSGVSVLMVVFFVVVAAAYVFLRSVLIRNEAIVSQLLGTWIPVAAGCVLLLVCLFHRGGGAGVRIAGAIEGVATVILVAILLRFSLSGGTNFGDDWYDRGMEMLHMTEGFSSVLYGILFVIFMYFLIFLPLIALAMIYRVTASRIKEPNCRDWLRLFNSSFHSVLTVIAPILFVIAFFIYNVHEGIFMTILITLFHGVFIALVTTLVFKICRRILG